MLLRYVTETGAKETVALADQDAGHGGPWPPEGRPLSKKEIKQRGLDQFEEEKDAFVAEVRRGLQDQITKTYRRLYLEPDELAVIEATEATWADEPRVTIREWSPGYWAAQAQAPKKDEARRAEVARKCTEVLLAHAAREGVKLRQPTLYPVKIKGDKTTVILAVVAQVLD